ncbi:MAG: hypothetical protein IT318_23760 [Anaerolineales bacterium]|nr:hypothetical protein [Anaerolineales bacterium]
MAWQALYETATGRLVSVGSVVAEPLPAGLAALALAGPPNVDGEMWDAGTRAFVARPAKVLIDRLDDLITDSRYSADLIALWNALNATNRNRLRTGLIRLLGSQRWRTAGEAVDLR